jgi:hypothetical protein
MVGRDWSTHQRNEGVLGLILKNLLIPFIGDNDTIRKGEITLIRKTKVAGLLLTKTISSKTPSITCPDDLFSRKSLTRSKNAVLEEKNSSFPRLRLKFLYGNLERKT